MSLKAKFVNELAPLKFRTLSTGQQNCRNSTYLHIANYPAQFPKKNSFVHRHLKFFVFNKICIKRSQSFFNQKLKHPFKIQQLDTFKLSNTPNNLAHNSLSKDTVKFTGLKHLKLTHASGQQRPSLNIVCFIVKNTWKWLFCHVTGWSQAWNQAQAWKLSCLQTNRWFTIFELQIEIQVCEDGRRYLSLMVFIAHLKRKC